MNLFSMFGSVALKGVKEVQRGLEQIDKKGYSVGKTFAIVGAAATALGAAIVTMSVKAANTADRVDKLSQKIGMSRQAFQEWDFIMSQAGGSVESLQMGIKTLSNAAEEARQGSDRYADAFKRLGVVIVDTNGQLRNQEDLLKETIAALSGMDNETERTAIASRLLGRSAQELAPLLNSGAESIEELTERAHELGLVLSDETVDAGVMLKDTIDELKRTFSALSARVLTPVMRILTSLGKAFLDTSKETAGFWGAFDKLTISLNQNAHKIRAVLGFIGEVFEIVFRYIRLIATDAINFISDNIFVPFVTWAAELWKKHGEGLGEIFSNAWAGILSIVSGVVAYLKDVWNIFSLAFQGDFEGAWNQIKETAARIWNSLPAIWQGVWDAISGLFEIIGDVIHGVIENVWGTEIADAFSDIWDSLLLYFSAFKDALLGVWGVLSSAFKGDWEGAWNGYKETAVALWESLPKLFDGIFGGLAIIADRVMSAIVSVIRDLFGENIAQIFENAWSAVRVVFDVALDALKTVFSIFANVFKGDWAAVWEDVKDLAQTVWEALPLLFESLFSTIVGIADTVMWAVIGIIAAIFGDRVSGIFETAWNTVKAVWDGTFAILQGIWDTFSSLFVGDWEGVWNGIKDIFSSYIGAIQSIFQGTFDILLSAWAGFHGAFVSMWEDIWNGVTSFFSSVWGTISAIFEVSLNSMTTFASSKLGDLKLWFSEMFESVVSSVKGTADGIIEWFSETKLGKAFAWVGEQTEKVTGWFRDMYDKVVGRSYVPDMVGEIGEAFQRLSLNMNKPVEDATQKASDDFKGLQDDVAIVAGVVLLSTEEIANAVSNIFQNLGMEIWDAITNITASLADGTATWGGVLQDFASVMGNALNSVFSLIAVEIVKNIVLQNAWVVATMTNIATVITGFFAQAFAALTAFYWFLGPLAPVAAGVTIAAAIAGIAALTGLAIGAITGTAPSVPDEPPGEGTTKTATGGRQISEITGPTRDLLSNLLSPLRALDSLTGIGNRIYDLLDERLLPHGGVTIGEININGTNLSQAEMIEALEEALGERIAFAGSMA